MSDRPFVHLHCHTHYSLLDGASRIPELVQRVKECGMNAVAMTDHGNLYGAIEFYKECKAAGVNPVIGYEAYVAPGSRTDREAKKRGDAGYHLTLLAKNIVGLKNLIKMSSIAFLEGYYYVPRIDKELLAAHAEGLICLSGCASAEFSEYILKDQLDEAARLAEWFARLFGKDFYVEIQNNGIEVQRLCAEGAIEVANRLGLPLVATSDAHYLRREDAPAHDVLLCINTGAKRADAKRMRYGNDDGKMIDQFYVRAPEEMYSLFPGHEEAVKRSQEIANGVDIQIDFKKRHFPVFTPPGGQSAEDYLRELCIQGMHERYGPEPSQTVCDRLEHELGIICRMGFASYFLITWDFVRFALESGIPASARGSGCGAIVSYVLKLSHVDPLSYDLLFERFLDPNRAEAPDIDIDFCQDRRERVIQYVKEKYGEASVAQIATFGTLAARAAIKDVGRALDVPLERVNQLTALVPKTLHITLDASLQQSPELRHAYESDPVIREVIDIARRLEGTNRNTGTHAAGVVIANGPLMDYVPLQRVVRKGEDAGSKKGEAVMTTQWVMGDLEKVGMLKMDFLGLRTLTLVDNCLRLIRKTRPKEEWITDIHQLPLDDQKTYELLQRGDAKGVFQFESDGIRELLKRLKPDNIRDIIACTALYRPGPLQGGMVDDFVDFKHGRKEPTYAHPIMEEFLSETYSVMVFQEQIMRMLNRLGGIELSSAYACIKAISKKKQEIIDQRKADFLRGAVERGLSPEVAQDIWDKIEVFAGYGFNKCVVGDTVIVDAMSGERTTVGDLFKNRGAFVIHALGEDGKLRPRQVTDVVWNGRKPVFELRTLQGKRITATDNHPFRTLNGWVEMGQLRPGDLIAAPRRLPIAEGKSWPCHEIIALAGLLSEGNSCHPTSLYFYNNDLALINDFAQAVACFPNTIARIHQRASGQLEVCANMGRDWRARRAACESAGPDLLVQERPPQNRSGAFRWAEKLNLLGRRATQKRVPPDVFRLCDSDLELFLGRLWAGDGFLADKQLAVPFYATSSPGLAWDVQTLLLRLGILSGVHEKVFPYKGELRPGYTVHLLGDGTVELFLARIAPHCLGRERQVELVRRHLSSTERGRTSKDTIPAAVRQWVDEERRKAGLTWKELEAQSDVSMKMFQGQPPSGKRGFRRSTISRLASFFGSQRLAEIANSDIFWDEVVSITPAGIEDTYDLTVEGDHNFVADGLIVHNSHSAAYAHVSYQTAYLKAHYTPEFFAALLSSEIEDGNKRDIMVEHISDAKRFGVEVLPPCVNVSEAEFGVVGRKVVFGLMAIKGFGRSSSEEVVRARSEGGPFRDLFDFCERVSARAVSKAAIEKLIKAGALDRLGGHRAQLLHALSRALQAAEDRQRDRKVGQGNLFEAIEEAEIEAGGGDHVLPEVPAWAEKDKLKFEKEVLDFYLSSHPLAQYEKELQRYGSHTADQLAVAQPDSEITLGGMITLLREFNTKKARNGNTRYMRCKMEDFSGTAECVMWPDDYSRYKDEVREDRICFARGTVERKPGSDPICVLNQIISVEQMQKEACGEVWLRMRLGEHGPNLIDRIAEIIKRYPGTCPVWLCVVDQTGKQGRLKLSRQFGINPLAFCPGEVEDILGPGSVKLVGSGGNGRNGR
jgi:DNA polymerase III subunit alpha